MQAQTTADAGLVLSYLTLRRFVGYVGIALPFVLALGNMMFTRQSGIESSISAYYHTVVGDIFVGSLCAIAVFLLSYHGYERMDDIAGDLACALAVGVALCPTTPADNASPEAEVLGGLHLAFAAAFFLVLAFFSLVLFRKTDPEVPPTPQKLRRNRVYTVCGYAILVALVLIVLVKMLATPDGALARLAPVFWLEALAVVAFGVSWLTKGEGILADR